MPDGEQVLATSKSNENKYSHCVKYLMTAMRKMSGEIFFLIILFAFTSYASLQKGALKVQMQPPPVPFFERNSTVKDFYWGEVATPFSSVINSDVSLILYYAPWDLDSQLTRTEFDVIAKQFEGQVYFTAINCWVHNGGCKQTFPKLRTFPIILGYVGGSKGVQYRGPLQHQYINTFVQHLLRPLKRIETISDLYTLKARNSAVVTGYINFSNSSAKPVGFYPFYVASLRYFEYDPYKSVEFALVTNSKAANQLGIHLTTPSSNQFDLRLHLWNETLIFPNNGSLDVNRFLQWIYFRSHSPITWVWPSNRKSQVIQHYFADQQRPSFVLFTPRLQESSQALVVREVALDYNNCVSSHRISRLVQEIKHQRELMEVARLTQEKKCSIFGADKYCITNYNMSITKDALFSVEEMCWPSSRPPSSILNPIQGLGCRTNRSLNFFLIDSKQYPQFLHNLGYTANQLRLNANVALIVDPKEESHFILNRPMTRENVEQLITNYTVGSVRRFRRNRPVFKNTLKYGTTSQIYVAEISGNEFEKVVLDPAYDVVVFYRKSGCVFCDVCNRYFLQVSQMFYPSKGFNWKGSRLNEIKFVSIDTDTNDVPWQFTVDKYPTFIFYPANRKMNSRVFPQDVEVNVANLLNFTLSQLSLKNRLKWFLHSCFQSNDHLTCLQEAQHQISAQNVIIDQHIRRLHYRLLWSESNSSMGQLRRWLKERFFYKELSYAILNYKTNQRRDNHQKANHNLYPEGFSLSN